MQNAKKTQKTLNVPDDLELTKITIPDIPKDIIFPDELNRYLRDQVQYLTHENGMLYKNLSNAELQIKESTTKINSLTSQLEEYQTCPKNSLASSTANLASSKIVELSKKLRERTSEMETYKTKCSKLEQYILELEKNKDQFKKDNVAQVEKPKNALEEQIKTLQEKLNSTHSKLCEARNSNTQLKNDLKMANKLLQQEVGESFETLVNSNTNWRGRAQIICDLQQKNIDLKEKLKMYQEKEKSQNNHENPMQNIKQDKRVENLTKENAELKNSFQGIKRKFDALKARNKVLESESTVLRSKVSAISEQNDRDHQLIATLTTKVSHAQETQNEAVYHKQLTIQKLEQENKSLQLELAKQTCKLDNYQAQIEEQKQEMENLSEKIRKQYPFSPPNTAATDTKAINQLQAERLRLLELTKLANERLESERAAHAATQSRFRMERQKAAKLEAKVARLELDQQTDRNSTYSAYSSKSRESDNSAKDRLELAEETIKALETRLQIERQEHKTDIDEFTKILRNYGYVQNTDRISNPT
ncbi:hypothetical protein ILUMI_10439 [Ignelater luminosus]|uniref:Coiled-coil domain-containing protein 13 n=1 Tax=Ignelater luminosus TaxID=2038154 RepID=A0A8K0D743_IGNLU|nr:hypothetical protein ILUMI_10439 [Ignelater luminosus]